MENIHINKTNRETFTGILIKCTRRHSLTLLSCTNVGTLIPCILLFHSQTPAYSLQTCRHTQNIREEILAWQSAAGSYSATSDRRPSSRLTLPLFNLKLLLTYTHKNGHPLHDILISFSEFAQHKTANKICWNSSLQEEVSLSPSPHPHTHTQWKHA